MGRATSASPAEAGDHILVFGPQCLTFDENCLSLLRQQLLREEKWDWAVDALRRLETYWDEIRSAFPVLGHLNGNQMLNDLSNWLNTASFDTVQFPLPNTILTPLVVVLHLTQQQQLRQSSQDDRFHTASETLGLCTGLLSAAATSSSQTEADIEYFGAKAIRVAMLLGAIVDATDEEVGPDDQAKSFAVTWSSQDGFDLLTKALKEIPQAYISVVQDARKVTVTTSASTSAQLHRQLKDSGFSTFEISLKGYFHWKGHQKHVESIDAFCKSHPDFAFGDGYAHHIPTRSNTSGEYIDGKILQSTIVKSILTEQSNWSESFGKLQKTWNAEDGFQLTYFGPERCVPSAIACGRGVQYKHIKGLGSTVVGNGSERQDGPVDGPGGDQIAVVGMAGQVPGAKDLDEFWSLLSRGQSQHVEVPTERFGFETAWRDSDPQRKWYGNFLEDYDQFDEKFFKKSPREMASTDPQQRVLLQVAYQALESSGYFHSSTQNKNIGCYIGLGLSDYESNVACHAANAYTATGNLRAFAAGKISHYFGWTGPGLTIDTACSSSAVAVHTACKAIISGDCDAALAGGANVMTSPDWFHNLAGASFLSPTGQCKPYDAKADGYCRGEAAGAVFLKRLSSAVRDGDQIFGVIAGSAVAQNQNCTAITVPNVPSLSTLFTEVAHRAGVSPKDVSYVEGHGTGTPVGDPAEYDSIRQVFGGPSRKDILSVGSVKGLVGHSEAASGLVALLKILVMMQHGCIPPQASFQTLNPALNGARSDRMEVCTKLRPWENTFKAALINNYGASGSNATLLVTQAPRRGNKASLSSSVLPSTKYPVHLFASDEQGLQRYCSRLLQFLQKNPETSLRDISFQMARQANHSLTHSVTIGCSTMTELKDKLQALESGSSGTPQLKQTSTRPVILCFGGQVSKFVGLDRPIYEEASILRKYLDECDSICQTMGVSIYPAIFQKSAIEDTVSHHISLFALQYASAMSWIDSGVTIASVVGHSFGELTALCVSGAMSVADALHIIAGRARLVRDNWGQEKGAMLAIRADRHKVEELLTEAAKHCPEEPSASIACFNGANSFTVAGSSKAINVVERIAVDNLAFSSIEAKRLDVTNAFHCSLVDSITTDLTQLAEDVQFKRPTIHIERATEVHDDQTPSPISISRHMRQPVYFHHAVQRLAEKFPSAIWLEAGSKSTIAAMAGRALGTPAGNYFQSINITSEGSVRQLTDATVSLRQEGLLVSFWPHHQSQASNYSTLLLPPYQFKRSRHWMELKVPPKISDSAGPELKTKPEGMWSFSGYTDGNSRNARFRVNTDSDKFQSTLRKHKVVKSHPLCPSTLQLDIAIDALMYLRPEFSEAHLQPQLLGMDSHAPMTLDPTRVAWLDANATHSDGRVWSWTISSEKVSDASSSTMHVSGTIAFRSRSNEDVIEEFSKYERLVRRQRCASLLESSDLDEVIQGKAIYRFFSDIVEYGSLFHGLQKLVSKGDESAGYVIAKESSETWLNFALGDAFCQVAGIYINCMTEVGSDDMFISDRIKEWIRSPHLQKDHPAPPVLEVYACHRQPSPREYVSDVFVFNPRDGTLMEVILGVHYQKVSRVGLGKALARLTGAVDAKSAVSSRESAGSATIPHTTNEAASILQGAPSHNRPAVVTVAPSGNAPPSDSHIVGKVTEILSNLSGLDPEEIKMDSDLADLGIDSLMAMELSREIESAFKCTPNSSDVYDLTDFQDLVNLIRKELGGTDQSTLQNNTNLHAKAPPSPISQAYDSGVEFETNFSNCPSTNGDSVLAAQHVLPANEVLETFNKYKKMTDEYVRSGGLGAYADGFLPLSNDLCIAYICDAFEQLGSPLRTAESGQKLNRINYLPQHEQYVTLLYGLLETEAGLIEMSGSDITRTAVAAPTRTATEILKQLREEFPESVHDTNLTALTGVKLADCLTGAADGLQIIFGTAEGREAASAMYGKSPINTVWIQQLQDFLQDLVTRVPFSSKEPLKILEMGSGTGGTTAKIVSLLAALNIPVKYTVTDISPSLVAAARKRFKQYSFMNYQVIDIEGTLPSDLLRTQHVVLSTNCIHVTHDLSYSLKNIHSLLRPDGFLFMLEMTQTLAWIDLIFGLLEGWWQFNDGRTHALAPATAWEKVLHSAGYGHVDWTDGALPESGIQRLIIAMASGPRYERDPIPQPLQKAKDVSTDAISQKVRQANIESYIRKYSEGFMVAKPDNVSNEATRTPRASVVLLTGATGSLGSHIVESLCGLPDVETVVCMNRRSTVEAEFRQTQALTSRGIYLSAEGLSKLKVFEGDLSHAMFGLSTENYAYLVRNVTHIIHNAWPMSLSRPVNGFVAQFQAMRNLLDLAREAYSSSLQPTVSPSGTQISFQFISSIATVGMYPLHTGTGLVPEERMTVESVLPGGYGDAKFVCERLVDETLHLHPHAFKAMSVRIGQISGSRASGYWNSTEHFAFMVKSSQTVKALPDLQGTLSWCPVNDVAATLSSLLTSPAAKNRIYHIEGPIRQPWPDMIQLLHNSLNVPGMQVVPFKDWVERVQGHSSPNDADNPAARIVGFLEEHFVRMSCGSLILDTRMSLKDSWALRQAQPVRRELLDKYVHTWRAAGFLA